MRKNNPLTNGLDRFSLHRSDKRWVNEKLHDGNSRIIPVHNLKILCDDTHQPKAVYLTAKNFAQHKDLFDSMILLGVYEETPYFAVDVNSDELAANLCQQANATFQDLKSLISLLDCHDIELLALARFMSFWHARNQYCGKCGNKTKIFEAGHVRICRNERCNEQYFPSMDPAVIVLVSSQERCLLGRKNIWPEGMYSTIAGFVEPGETIEDAVAREVQEETGIHIDKVAYQHSQAWLFPSSLMLGFTATARDEEITIDTNELADARWFTRNEIKSDPRLLPYKVSIAYKLITEWLSKGD